MRSSVCPTLTTAAIVHGLSTDDDRRSASAAPVQLTPYYLSIGVYLFK